MDKPICPRCERAVTSDPHELRLELVNAHPTARKDHVLLEGTFHPACAAAIWTAARRVWFGEDR